MENLKESGQMNDLNDELYHLRTTFGYRWRRAAIFYNKCKEVIQNGYCM